MCVCKINELETKMPVLGLNEKLIRRTHISTAGKRARIRAVWKTPI